MHCQAVMHVYTLVKMPKIETLVHLGKSQEVLARYYCYFLCEKHLKIEKANSNHPHPTPTPDRVEQNHLVTILFSCKILKQNQIVDAFVDC